MKMKLRQNQSLTQPRISKHEVIHSSETTRQDEYFECITNCHIDDQHCNEKCVNTLKNEYVHPWDTYVEKLNKPNPPSQEAIEKAKFIDKTYVWNSGTDSVRPRNKRSTK